MQVIAHRVDVTPDIFHLDFALRARASKWRPGDARWRAVTGPNGTWPPGRALNVPQPDTPPRSPSVHG
jgi:hypothetical protein